MEEIRALAKKHIKAKEDLANRLEAERKVQIGSSRNNQGYAGRVIPQQEGNYKSRNEATQFTPLKIKSDQLFREKEVGAKGQSLRPNLPKVHDEEWSRDKSRLKSRLKPPYRDYVGMFPHQDDPMVISIVVVEYKSREFSLIKEASLIIQWMEELEPFKWTSVSLDNVMRKA
ncbi:hypothetical protein CR513_43949, partial [Mucuna pruriens]